jgi:hypothetical protein
MGADKLTQNTSNAPKFICPNPEVWDFDEKRLYQVSVIRGLINSLDIRLSDLHDKN